MALNKDKNLKLYISISEVAQMFDVNESTLRFWEKEFDQIRPRKAGKGTRSYRQEDIDAIRLVYHLVKERGMPLAGARLDPPPEFLAIDGNRFRTRLELPYRCVVKGDGKYADIAAASVLAKTHRDEYMLRLAEEYPQYGWKKNKGYPTREHRLAIREYGLTPHHRLSFSHGIGQLELQF